MAFPVVLSGVFDRLEVIFSGSGGAVLFLFLWLVVGSSIILAVTSAVRRHAVHTRTDLDNLIVKALRIPFLILWSLLGLYIFAVGFDLFSRTWELRATVLLLIFMAFIAAHAVVRLCLGFLERRAKQRPAFRGMQGILSFLLRLGLYSLALLLVLDHLGMEITPLLGAFGIGGLAVALALQDTLANFFAGIYLTIDRPLHEGDYLEIDGGTFGTIRGFVVEIGWRSVRLRELSNNIFVVPNGRLASGIIKNYDMPQGEMSVVVQASVAYGSDLPHVEQVVVDVARQCQESVTGAVTTHEPFVRFHTFGDNGIHFSTILRVKTFVDQYLLTHEFLKRLDVRFREEDIVVPFPQRTLHWGRTAGPTGAPDDQGVGGEGPDRQSS